MLKKLEEVDEDSLEMFDETADLLLQKHQNNPKMAIKVLLGYIAGHSKAKIPQQSLITGR